MINRCLVIHEIDDFGGDSMRHFSSTKGFLFAEGMSKHVDCFYLTTGSSSTIDGVRLLNIEQIRREGIESFDLIVITREFVFPELFDSLPEILELMLDGDRKAIIAHKGDSFGWIKNNGFRKSFSDKTGKIVFSEIGKMFDIICSQTEQLAQRSKSSLPKDVCEKIEDSLFISRMGVPERIPYSGRDKDKIQKFPSKEDYCVDYWFDLKAGLALRPLCFTEKHVSRTLADYSKFNEEKTKIIYSGRIKMDQAKIFYLMKDIMLELGDEFELHIFPGSFMLPGVPVKVFSSKFPVNVQLIRDRHFAECPNVIVHYPFDSKMKEDVFASMDIGLDFSQARPADETSIMGNAKLLEYCYYGLKSVTERNVHNSDLSVESGGGIALKGIASAKDYADAIKKLKKRKIDWRRVSKYTYSNHGWDKITSEFLDEARKRFAEKNGIKE